MLSLFQSLIIPRKEKLDEQVIDSGFKTIIESKITENMDIHFVCAGSYLFSRDDLWMESFILKRMKKYKINKAMLTIFHMWKSNLITKEKMLDYCNGKKQEKESVNDDLDSLFEDLCIGKEPDEAVSTYFLPQLTKKELDLVAQKDSDFMNTFWKKMKADVDKAEMAASESDSKYAYGFGYRRTYTIKNSPK